MAKLTILILAAAAAVVVANAHFISHPGRFHPHPHPAESSAEADSSNQETAAEGHSKGHGYGYEGHGQQSKWKGGFPEGIKVDKSTLNHLKHQMKEEMEAEQENFNFEETDAFTEVEDEEDFDLDWDENAKEFPLGDFSDTTATTKVWKREFGLTRILVVAKNGTKSFFKSRDSTKIEGDADVTIDGNLNTTLTVAASGSADFSVNSTFSAKGKDTKITTDGDANSESSSSSKIGKDRLLSKSTAKSDITINDPKTNTPMKLTYTVNTKSETFGAPFRTFLTLFASTINTTTKVNGTDVTYASILKGEVTSHVLFVKNGTSLTKLKVKAYMTSKAGGYKQLVLIKSKTHIWTKVSKSDNGNAAIVDVYTSTKTRAYGKGVVADTKIYSGAGSVALEKSQITVSMDEAEDFHESRAGMHVMHGGASGHGMINSAMLSSLKI